MRECAQCSPDGMDQQNTHLVVVGRTVGAQSQSRDLGPTVYIYYPIQLSLLPLDCLLIYL